MYEFGSGKIKLDCKSGEYKIIVDGKEIERPYINDCQKHNPVLAINSFINEISRYMRGNVKSYLASVGGNPTMGCKINMPCSDCQIKRLNGPDSNCMLGGIKLDE